MIDSRPVSLCVSNVDPIPLREIRKPNPMKSLPTCLVDIIPMYADVVDEVYAICSIVIHRTDRFSGRATKYYVISHLPFAMRSGFYMMVFNRLKKDASGRPDRLFEYSGNWLRITDVGRAYYDYYP